MIDLHLHTTASDGQSAPGALVEEARAAGVWTLAVTDHDTVAGVRPVRAAALGAGLAFLPGIEVTAIQDGRDVHVLGYFLDPDDEAFAAFLDEQRLNRRRRLVEIVERLSALGIGLDADRLLSGAAGPGRAVGRPLVGAALVEAGHARDLSDAFERYLGEGRPAFVPRQGVPVSDVIARIAAAGGVSSLAHPGKNRRDELIPGFATAGLVAIEVFHPDHSEEDVVRYRRLAVDLGLLVTGGSDYHGPDGPRAGGLGRFGTPEPDFHRLVERAARQRPA